MTVVYTGWGGVCVYLREQGPRERLYPLRFEQSHRRRLTADSESYLYMLNPGKNRAVNKISTGQV